MLADELVRVNIYNRGRIPFLNVFGPIYASTISRTLFERLVGVPEIRMELLDFGNPHKVLESYNVIRKSEKKEAYTETEKKLANSGVSKEDLKAAMEEVLAERDAKLNEIKNQVSSLTKETKTQVENISETDEEDEPLMSPEGMNDLDAAIEAASNEYDPSEDFQVDASKVMDDLKSVEVVKYTKKKLEGMTKAQMKQVLIDRGYTEGEFAPRYHDTLDKLKTKILKTQ